MENKKFRRLLAIIAAVGILCTAGLTGYTVYLKEHCSILTCISNE